jgi:hypothetical protein
MITEDLVYELIIEGEEDEVYAISMVSEPAIEAGWVAFDKEQVQFQAVDNDKRLVLGPILVPDKRILRIDGEGKPYHVFLSAPTIKKLSEKYLQNKYTDKVTVEHQKSISDVSLVESWIVESRTKDKSAVYGLSLTPGTWAGTMKVNNEKLWQDFVKTGKLTGFSIEGLFSHQLVEASKENYLFKEIDELTEYEAEIVLSKIKAMFESYADYGDEIKNNAKRGIELNEKVGNKCATQTGKVRAQQLANGEAISVETIKRMYSFLSRAETYYDETDTTACGTISYLLWGGKSALSYSRNKLRELGILEEAEQPSVVSSYPGEAAEDKKKVKAGDIPPILQDFATCPESTKDIKLNIANRQKAIDEANYGPINPNEPNEDYWKAKADQFKGNVEEAKKALCGNCVFFYRTPQILKCIAEGLGQEVDPYEAIEAGELGYCEAFDFKCAASRTCAAWVVGGPITE